MEKEVTRDLVAIGNLVPGSLFTQYSVCGTSGCRGQGLRLKGMVRTTMSATYAGQEQHQVRQAEKFDVDAKATQ
jgi:hypothetical protein